MSAPKLVLENVQLETFERLIYARKHEDAFKQLCIVLSQLRAGGEFTGYPYPLDATWVKHLYTRVAAAITTLFADPECKLSTDGFNVLAPHHAVISAIFKISGFDNGDHIAKLVGEEKEGKIDWQGQFNVLKMLLCYSLDSQIEIDLETMYRRHGGALLRLWLAMVSHGINLMPEDESRHTRLLKLAPIFADVEVDPALLSSLSDGYMHCSYSTSPERHEVKRTYNKMLRSLFKQIDLPKLEPVKRDRPVVLLLLERFCSTHAMFRVYGNAIRTLREKFEVRAIVGDNEIDDEARELFDSVQIVNIGIMLKDIVQMVAAVAPDIVYYPSVGMSAWTIALSSVRLAPIQIMSPGHPATTHSEAMDYVVVDEPWKPGWGTWSETVIVKPGCNFAIPSDARYPGKDLSIMNPSVRVAVPAMLCKFNAQFMAMCKRVYDRTGCQFEFIPNMIGLTHYYGETLLHKWLPSANVWPRHDFNEYTRRLSECDMVMSTFPFGGTNSTFEALKVGLPVVTLKNKEIFGRTDAGLIRAAGLPEYLICSSETQYENVACDLIVNHDKRRELTRFLSDCDMEHNLRDGEAKLCDVFEWIYLHHDAMKASGKKYFKAFQKKDLEEAA